MNTQLSFQIVGGGKQSSAAETADGKPDHSGRLQVERNDEQPAQAEQQEDLRKQGSRRACTSRAARGIIIYHSHQRGRYWKLIRIMHTRLRL